MAENKKIGLGDVVRGVGKAVGDAIDRLVPQGRDELANAIFNGSAYWPGSHPPSLASTPQHGIHGPAAEPAQPGMETADGTAYGTILPPETPGPSSGPARPALEMPVIEGEARDVTPKDVSYNDLLSQASARIGSDRDRGRGMSR